MAEQPCGLSLLRVFALPGMKMFGRAWKTIAKQVVKTRTAEQVGGHELPLLWLWLCDTAVVLTFVGDGDVAGPHPRAEVLLEAGEQDGQAQRYEHRPITTIHHDHETTTPLLCHQSVA